MTRQALHNPNFAAIYYFNQKRWILLHLRFLYCSESGLPDDPRLLYFLSNWAILAFLSLWFGNSLLFIAPNRASPNKWLLGTTRQPQGMPCPEAFVGLPRTQGHGAVVHTWICWCSVFGRLNTKTCTWGTSPRSPGLQVLWKYTLPIMNNW